MSRLKQKKQLMNFERSCRLMDVQWVVNNITVNFETFQKILIKINERNLSDRSEFIKNYCQFLSDKQFWLTYNELEYFWISTDLIKLVMNQSLLDKYFLYFHIWSSKQWKKAYLMDIFFDISVVKFFVI